jgi:phospholipase/carboxylesterase
MLTAQRTRLESLDCIVVDGGPSPRIAVVICHGYGATYEDLAPLAGEWAHLLGERAGEFRFVFPDAPHTLADVGMPEGRAWWPINMAQLSAAVAASSFDELHDREPPGIVEARETLCGTIERVKNDLSGDATPLVLGGFSQGAMLTMDTSLRGNVDPPQLLIQFSGTVVCRTEWKAALARLEQTPVFQSHGKIDPILPYSSAVALNEMLTDAQLEVNFYSFVGPHTIDAECVARTAQALDAVARSHLDPPS